MMSAVRLSRRAVFGAVFTGVFVVIALLAVKDLNDKLGVMTATNAGYQKMIDSQAETIGKLNKELKDSRQGHKWDTEEFTRKESDYKARLGKAEDELKNGSKSLREQLARAGKDLDSLRRARDRETSLADEERLRLERANADLKSAKEAGESELRERLLEAEREVELCKSNHSELLRKRNESAVMPEQRQSKVPSVLKRPKAAQSSTRAADGGMLEEPANAGKLPPPQVALRQPHGADAPVAAEPPLAAAAAAAVAGSGGEVAPVVRQNAPPDGVVEAPEQLKESGAGAPGRQRRPLGKPKVSQRQKPNAHRLPKGENLDQMVDHVQQDNPGHPGPLETGHLDRDFQQQEEENEADDAVDGRLYRRIGALQGLNVGDVPGGGNEEDFADNLHFGIGGRSGLDRQREQLRVLDDGVQDHRRVYPPQSGDRRRALNVLGLPNRVRYGGL